MPRSARTTLKSSPASLGYRQKRSQFRQRMMLFFVILFALLGAGLWWGLNTLQSADTRSQASVDQSFRLVLVPDTGIVPAWDVRLSAYSNQARATQVSGVITPQTQDAGVVELTTADRRIFENDRWLVTTTQPEDVVFTVVENQGKLQFSARAPEGVLVGELVILRLWSKFAVVESARNLWQLEQPSVKGWLESTPGIEVELMSKDQKRVTSSAECLATIKRCPQMATLVTNDQFPCGVCFDQNGNPTGPTPPSPLP